LKLVSLLLASFLWFSINVSERDAERIIDLPLVVRRLPAGLIVTNPPRPVAVTLRGPRTILDGVDGRRARLAVNLASVSPGDARLELNGDMLRPQLPHRVKVVRLDPARLRIHVERLVRRVISVRADLAGMPALGYTVVQSRVTPAQVEVTGPASKVEALKEITTEPIELRGLAESAQRYALLSWAGNFVSFSPDHVTVGIAVEEVMVSREFKQVSVQVRQADGMVARLTPVRVDVTVRGPQRLLNNYEIADGAAYVDATGLPAGRHQVTVEVSLPPAMELTRLRPPRHTLRVTEGEGR
jgi:YbbR domain-containing protein